MSSQASAVHAGSQYPIKTSRVLPHRVRAFLERLCFLPKPKRRASREVLAQRQARAQQLSAQPGPHRLEFGDIRWFAGDREGFERAKVALEFGGIKVEDPPEGLFETGSKDGSESEVKGISQAALMASAAMARGGRGRIRPPRRVSRHQNSHR